MSNKIHISIPLIILLIISHYAIGQSTVTVANGGKMKITSGTSIQSKNLDIGSGSQLVNRGDLTVTGVLANDAGSPGLVLKADENGYGALMNNSTGVLAEVEQYLSSERWHLISSPVAWPSTEAYWDIYLKDWTEPASSWYYITDPAFWPSLYPTEGYAVWADDNYTGTTTVTLEGELITGDISYNYLSHTPTTSQEGWNLVGNPYPSSVEWNTDWTIWHLSGWALFYENGVYDGWNPWLPAGEQSYNGRTDGWMAPSQGFWIRAVDADPYMSSPQSARAHHPDPFLKANQISELKSLHLTVSANSYSDEATILFLEGASEGFDGLYDLEKMYNVDEAPNIYSYFENETKYSVNVIPDNWIEQAVQASIPVGYKVGSEMVCSLSASGINSFDPSTPILLEDLQEDYIQNLRDNPEYSFTSGPDDPENRFVLHFISPNDVNSNKLNIFAFVHSYNSDIYIKLPPHSSGNAVVFNTKGQEVDNFPVSDQLTKKRIGQKGIYIVRLQKGDKFSTTKVYIR